MGRGELDGVNDGEWSVFAEKVVEERDAALAEVERHRWRRYGDEQPEDGALVLLWIRSSDRPHVAVAKPRAFIGGILGHDRWCYITAPDDSEGT